MKKSLLWMGCAVLLFCFLVAPRVWADVHSRQLEDDMGTAYAEYRKALLFSNQNNKQQALHSLRNFKGLWDGIIETYARQNPCPYDLDPEWGSSLRQVGTIIDKGLRHMEEGNLTEAHETIEAVREKLAEMRRRNNVVHFSDHIDRYHEQMERLLKKQYRAENVTPSVLNEIREMLAILDYLMGNIRNYAPEGYRTNKEFQVLVSDNLDILQSVHQALDKEDGTAVIAALKNLKPAYAKLFVKFG